MTGDVGVGDPDGYYQRVYERMETLIRERDEARQRAERAEAALRLYRDAGYVHTHEFLRLMETVLADPQPAEVGGEE